MLIPNMWYAVLESSEVKPGKPLGVKRMGEELVFWRDKQGQIVVMRDRCPHRQSKLSPGKIVDGNLQCHFHGFQFNREGACQLVPANGRNGPKPKIFQCWTYPSREAFGLIWVWNGEPRQEYPPLPFVEGLEDHSYGGFQVEWNVHYTRALEGVLDVSHLPFVHAKTIGRGGKTLVNGPYTTLEGNQLRVWISNQPDAGLPAIKPTQVPPPNRPADLRLNFPNVWQLYLSDKVSMVQIPAPVDEEHTVIYLRFYQRLVKQPVLSRLLNWVGCVQNRYILNEDRLIIESQWPKMSDLETGGKFIPGDRPIALYLQHRRDLIQAAERANQARSATEQAFSYVPEPALAERLS